MKWNSCKTWKQQNDYLKWTSKPNYMSHKIFDSDVVAIRKNKVTLTLNKPTYIGMCILELSKVLMYKFHDDYIKNQYHNNSRILFTDTASLPGADPRLILGCFKILQKKFYYNKARQIKAILLQIILTEAVSKREYHGTGMSRETK